MVKKLTEREFNTIIKLAGLSPEMRGQLGRWIARGDGVAVYRKENGHRQVVSYGGRHAQIHKPLPPHTMPKGIHKDHEQYELEGCYPGLVGH